MLLRSILRSRCKICHRFREAWEMNYQSKLLHKTKNRLLKYGMHFLNSLKTNVPSRVKQLKLCLLEPLSQIRLPNVSFIHLLNILKLVDLDYLVKFLVILIMINQTTKIIMIKKFRIHFALTLLQLQWFVI